MNRLSRCKPLLGTFVEIAVWGDADRDRLLAISEAAFQAIAQVDALMSFHREDSELSRLNRQAFRRPCRVSAQTLEVLRQALYLSRLSDGLFDVSIAPELIAQGLLPHAGAMPETARGCWKDIRIEGDEIRFERELLLDLGGIAKGYAVDRALGVLESLQPGAAGGELRLLVNAGGDLRLSHWQGHVVAVRHPALETGTPQTLAMRAPALATSASYFINRDVESRDGRRSAIVNPQSRHPMHREHSVSVFAPTCMLADALTKLVFLDPDCDRLLCALGAQALVLDPSGDGRWLGADLPRV
ncbi:MAG: FAD:protein FMN transferase [Gammaproteobacteria bacterium]|nr:FAD:protein FMN transferase [Gammaproteobacteria bacterium]